MIGMTIATSALSTYGGQRILDLVVSVEQGRFVFDLVSPEEYPTVFPVTYINSAIQTISEMAFMGMIASIITIVIAMFIRQKENNA